MSVHNVVAFFDKVEKDEALQRKLKALAEKRKAQDRAMVAELVKIAEDAGFKFTAADYAEARRQEPSKLSASELARRRSERRCWPFGGLMDCTLMP